MTNLTKKRRILRNEKRARSIWIISYDVSCITNENIDLFFHRNLLTWHFGGELQNLRICYCICCGINSLEISFDDTWNPQDTLVWCNLNQFPLAMPLAILLDIISRLFCIFCRKIATNMKIYNSKVILIITIILVSGDY